MTKDYSGARFNFDTYKLVRQLEKQGVTRAQAVAIMRTINECLENNTFAIQSKILLNAELENVFHILFKSNQEIGELSIQGSITRITQRIANVTTK